MDVIEKQSKLRTSSLDVFYCRFAPLHSASWTKSWEAFVSRLIFLASNHSLFPNRTPLDQCSGDFCCMVSLVLGLIPAWALLSLPSHTSLACRYQTILAHPFPGLSFRNPPLQANIGTNGMYNLHTPSDDFNSGTLRSGFNLPIASVEWKVSSNLPHHITLP